MKLGEYEWRGINSNVSDVEMSRFENQNKIKLPEDYKKAILKYNGGIPSKCSFPYEDPMYGPVNTVFGMMLSFCKCDEDNIFESFDSLKDQLPDRVYPIIDDGAGDYVCFDYRNAEVSPRLVYWCHELSLENSIVPLADTFTDFIENKLRKKN